MTLSALNDMTELAEDPVRLARARAATPRPRRLAPVQAHPVFLQDLGTGLLGQTIWPTTVGQALTQRLNMNHPTVSSSVLVNGRFDNPWQGGAS